MARGGNGGELDEFIALEMQTLQTDSVPLNPRRMRPSSTDPHSSSPTNSTFRPTSSSSSSSRKPLVACESCGENARRPAVVYCENCCGSFCADCDARFHPRTNLVMSRHTRTPAELPRSSHIRCRAHPDDPVTYFCLDCMVLSCSECVVHGPHRTHNVQDKRKSYYLIKDKTEDVLTQFHAQAEELATLLRRIDQLKVEIIENTRSVKQTMAMSFNEVRDRLNKKEEELMANADVFLADQVGQLDMYVNSTRDKVEMLDAVSGMVQEQLNDQDEVGLIHFYAENNTQFHELSSTIASLSQDVPLVATRKCYLDVDAANAQISSLQGLHLLIAGLTNESPSPSPSPSSSDSSLHLHLPTPKYNTKTPAKHTTPPSSARSNSSKTPARSSSSKSQNNINNNYSSHYNNTRPVSTPSRK